MRRRRAHPNSLELLLDTMCNTFGGIIMIALLIALLSRDGEAGAREALRREAAEKRLAMARGQAEEARELRRRLLGEGVSPEAAATLALLAERDELRRRIEEDRARRESNMALATALRAPSDPEESKRLAAEKQAKEMEARALAERVERETQGRQRQMRLPRERATGKKTFYFIVRHGRLYPVHLMREGQRELNTQSLDWRTGPDGETANPRRDSGLDGVTGLPAFARFLGEIPSAAYSIHFLVYNDSFPAFLGARQIPTQRGYDVGWEFLPEDRPIIFSSRGEAPPAL